MSYTLDEKIKLIENSKTLGDIPIEAMPYMQSDDYYFVSYSHRDYKKVYSDILRLQNLGINVWYDRGLPPGKNWQDMADEAISKHSCIGVIFYLSENSLLSDAVAREILFVKGKQKDYLSINIPIDECCDKSLSASSMMQFLKTKHDFSKKKQDIIEQSFNDEVLFVDYDATAEFKADKLKLLKRPPVLQYSVKYDRLKGGKYAVVENVLDLFAKEINVPKSVKINDEEIVVKEIDECAFANCKYLKRVNFAKYSRLYMKKYAFYGCVSLTEIDAHNFEEIEDFAFLGCSSLEKIILSSDTIIGNGVFGGTKLNDIKIIKAPGEQLIESTERLDVRRNRVYSTLIGKGSLKKYGYSFNENVLLYDTPNQDGELRIGIFRRSKTPTGQKNMFSNEDLAIFAIGDSTFSKRENLQIVSAVPSIRVIGEKTFEDCVNLKCFNYFLSTVYMQRVLTIGYQRALALKEKFHSQPLLVGERAFNGCVSMEKVELPPFIRISEYAFANCSSLKTVRFSVVKHFSSNYWDCKNAYIGEYSFFNCISLAEIIIPQPVKEIKQFAFANCKELSIVKLSAESNLKIIDKTAFFGCKKLSEISFNGTIEQFLQIKQTGEGESLQQRFRIVCLDGTV